MNGGKRPGAGRKPLWDTERIRELIKENTEIWWTEISRMMQSRKEGERKFALAEFNKLQVKALPLELTGKDGKDLIPTPILANLHSKENAQETSDTQLL